MRTQMMLAPGQGALADVNASIASTDRPGQAAFSSWGARATAARVRSVERSNSSRETSTSCRASARTSASASALACDQRKSCSIRRNWDCASVATMVPWTRSSSTRSMTPRTGRCTATSGDARQRGCRTASRASTIGTWRWSRMIGPAPGCRRKLNVAPEHARHTRDDRDRRVTHARLERDEGGVADAGSLRQPSTAHPGVHTQPSDVITDRPRQFKRSPCCRNLDPGAGLLDPWHLEILDAATHLSLGPMWIRSSSRPDEGRGGHRATRGGPRARIGRRLDRTRVEAATGATRGGPPHDPAARHRRPTPDHRRPQLPDQCHPSVLDTRANHRVQSPPHLPQRKEGASRSMGQKDRSRKLAAIAIRADGRRVHVPLPDPAEVSILAKLEQVVLGLLALLTGSRRESGGRRR